MKRPVLTLMSIVTVILVAFVAMGQVLPNLPQNTVWGRLGIGTGPGQAIPLSTLGSLIATSSGPSVPVGNSGGIPSYISPNSLVSTSTLSAGDPIIGGGVGTVPGSGTRTGTSTLFATAIGTFVDGNCPSFSTGSLIDSGAPCGGGSGGSGTVTAGTTNQLARYAANGTVVSGLATANNGALVTNSSGVPSIGPVPNATLSTMPADTTKCNPTTSTAAVEDCTIAQMKSLLTAEISVTDPAFGAKCDGTTDDTTAIQAAINSLPASGGIVYFPVATCRISSSLTIGNGTTSAFSTRQGVFLIGRGNPNAPELTVLGGGYTATLGPKLQWLGAGTGGMIVINGPMQGWGVQNLHMDCGNASQYGIFLSSSSFGDSKNLSFTNCTVSAIFSTSHPKGGYTGAPNVDSLRNNYKNIAIQISSASVAKGITLTGDAGGTSDTDYNIIDNVIMSFPTTNLNQAGVYMGVSDSNIFRGISTSTAQSTHYGLFLDYSVNAQFPNSNMFFAHEFGGTIPYGVGGAPSINLHPNYAFGTIEANGVVPPNNVSGLKSSVMSTSGNNSAWLAYTANPGCGTASITVNSAKYTTMNKATSAQLDVTITAAGTCTSTVAFSLPATSNSGGGFVGREITNSFLGVSCVIAGAGQTTASCIKTSLGNFATNDRVIVSGTYESQ